VSHGSVEVVVGVVILFIWGGAVVESHGSVDIRGELTTWTSGVSVVSHGSDENVALLICGGGLVVSHGSVEVVVGVVILFIWGGAVVESHGSVEIRGELATWT
jgi:hypothetical protein